MPPKYKIIPVDDHDILRDGLKFVLTQLQFAEIIAEARNGIEFLKVLETHQPDVVLMDIDMPLMDGIEATKAALKKFPELKVIALSMFGDQEHYFQMIQAGAKGFVLKKAGLDELQNAITSVMNGENFFSNDLLRNIIVSISENKLSTPMGISINITKREMEVLQQICNGLSNNEIAERLHISSKTVEGHRNSLLSKTQSKNTVSLVMYAIKNKLILI
jgi:DNA-binding NarL/FixJ family response regulator